jgi:hypothetical protein
MSSGVNEMEYYDQTFSRVRGLGLWCLTPLSTIFQLYRDGQLHWWRKRRTRRKPPTCCKSLTKFITYRVHLAIGGFELTTFVVIKTDYTGSCKSNYHTITTTMAPTRVRVDCKPLFPLAASLDM